MHNVQSLHCVHGVNMIESNSVLITMYTEQPSQLTVCEVVVKTELPENQVKPTKLVVQLDNQYVYHAMLSLHEVDMDAVPKWNLMPIFYYYIRHSFPNITRQFSNIKTIIF